MPPKPATMTPVEILDSLRAYSFLAPFNLALFSQRGGIVARNLAAGQLCGYSGATANCGRSCTLPLDDALRAGLARDLPVLSRCPLGLLGFVVRLPDPALADQCLLAWGVRGSSINLFYLENMSKTAGIEPFTILDRLGSMPVVELEGVRDAAERVHRLLPSHFSSNLHNQVLETTVSRLSSVVGISSQLDRGKSLDEVVGLLSEAFGVLFDCQQIAVAISGQDSEAFAIKGTWGLPPDLGQTSRVVLHRLLAANPDERSIKLTAESSEFFQTMGAANATFLPLLAGTELLGGIFLPDIELPPRDTLLAEILTGRAAARLLQLRNEANHYADSSLPARMIAATSSMLAATDLPDLQNRILATAAELLGASSGSLMLLDGSGQQMKIVAAIGLNDQISKSLTIKLGDGIAGRVAASGTPIVVNDIENDSRVATTNRPRYRTKSFISAPIRSDDRLLGVLNLADKSNNDIFTENDLQLVVLLLGQAVMVRERLESRRQADQLAGLAAVDPATSLYNRSFLDKRLAEELNRSQRQELRFALVMVELDHLPLYASICGAAAADAAIRKTVAAITGSARQMDVVCNFSSDTYCLILPGTAREDAMPVAERISRACAELKVPGAENLPAGRFSTSIGLAGFPGDGDTAEALLNNARSALYRAKAEGRDCIVCA